MRLCVCAYKPPAIVTLASKWIVTWKIYHLLDGFDTIIAKMCARSAHFVCCHHPWYSTLCYTLWDRMSVCARKRDGAQFVRTILWSRVAHVTSAQHWSICTYRDRTNSFIYLSIQPSIHPSTFYPRRDQMRQREWITVSVAIHLLDDLEAKYQQYLISTAHSYLLVQVWIDNLPIDKFEFDESACVFIYI